jgi:hypothetical protein
VNIHSPNSKEPDHVIGHRHFVTPANAAARLLKMRTQSEDKVVVDEADRPSGIVSTLDLVASMVAAIEEP